MFLLVIIPEGASSEEFLAIPETQRVQFSQLPGLEEKAARLVAQAQRLLSSTLSRYLMVRPGDPPLGGLVLGFRWAHLFGDGSDVLRIAEGLAEQGESLRQEVQRVRAPGRGRGRGVALGPGVVGADEEMLFLEALCYAVSPRDEPRVRERMGRIVPAESVLRVPLGPEAVLYKVYVLRKEAAGLCARMDQIPGCRRVRGGGASEQEVRLPGDDAADGDDDEYASLLSEKVVECAKFYFKASFYRAYVESLHRYGYAARFRYKILDLSRPGARRELRRIRRALIATETVDAISDDEEFPFTRCEIGIEGCMEWE